MLTELLMTITPPGGAPAVGTAETQGITSIWDFVQKGGPAMILIALCSLVALAVVVERALLLRKSVVVPRRLLADLEAAGGDTSRAIDACNASASPLGAVILAALQRRGQTAEVVQKAMEDAGKREVIRLRKRMRLLGGLPQIATMLGLLGTIFGMITTFQTIAFAGQSLGKTELLAKGIFEAWTCTAGGLLVAIPTLIAFHTLMGRIEGLMVELDTAAESWLTKEQASARPRAHHPATGNGTLVTPRMTEESASVVPA